MGTPTQESTNFGYTIEVTAHWISSYFLGDTMRIPRTPEAALAETARAAAWLRARYPELPTALHGSKMSYFAFWTYVVFFSLPRMVLTCDAQGTATCG